MLHGRFPNLPPVIELIQERVVYSIKYVELYNDKIYISVPRKRRSTLETGDRLVGVLADPSEITDPDTGKVLATTEREKVRVQATEVHDIYSICSTYCITRFEGGEFHAYAQLLTPTETPYREPRPITETLRIEESRLAPSLSEEESHVKIGDRVVQILKSD